MILSGEKKEDYRAIKEFYTKRFCKMFGLDEKSLFDWFNRGSFQNIEVTFINGYSKSSPSFTVDCMLYIGKGKVEWGAEQNVDYYIFRINGKCKVKEQ